MTSFRASKGKNKIDLETFHREWRARPSAPERSRGMSYFIRGRYIAAYYPWLYLSVIYRSYGGENPVNRPIEVDTRTHSWSATRPYTHAGASMAALFIFHERDTIFNLARYTLAQTRTKYNYKPSAVYRSTPSRYKARIKQIIQSTL